MIYGVSSGEYSDYRILAMFDCRDKAQKYINRWGSRDYDDMNIEEYELNPSIDEINSNLDFYSVSMNYEGVVNNIRNDGIPRESVSRVSYCRDHRTKNKFLLVDCFAKDEKHAIKITNEKRTLGIAMNKWAELE